MVKVSLPASFDVDAAGNTLTVDMAQINDAVAAYIFGYGLKQMLNDAHASVTATTHPKDAERLGAKQAKAEAKLASLYAGEIAQQRGGSGNAIEREMETIARGKIRAALKAAGRKADKDKMAELVKAYLAKRGEELRPEAEAIVAARKNAVADAEFDLDDIL